jgi:hypothetical protein
MASYFGMDRRRSRGGSAAPSTRRPRGSAVLALALAGITVLAGCAQSGSHYVISRSAHTYFKVPGSWKVFDSNAVKNDVVSQDPSQADAMSHFQWMTAFDGSPQPSLHPDDANTFPSGYANVLKLGSGGHEKVSYGTLNGLVIDTFDTELQAGTITVLQAEDLHKPKGFWGRHLVFRRSAPGSAPYVVDQTALVDDAASKLYVLVLHCGTDCYSHNHSTIKTITQSWTVTE